MTTNEDFTRISRLADERMAGLKIPSADRPTARREMIAAIEKEERDVKAADEALAEAAASAAAERARINTIVGKGRDLGNGRQALRLALSGPVTPEQAGAILPGLRSDADAPEAGVLPGSFPVFGTAAEQTERTRIAAIFSSPVAAERFGATCSFALLGDAPVAAVVGMLAQIEPEFAPKRLLTIAERAAGMTEAGHHPWGGQDAMSKQEKIAAGWSKAVKAANESIGVPTAASPPVAPTPGLIDACEAVPDWIKQARR